MDFITGIIPILLIIVTAIFVFRFVVKKELNEQKKWKMSVANANNGDTQCPKCGDQVDDDALFCRNCGTKFDEYLISDNSRKDQFIIAGIFSFVCAALIIPLFLLSIQFVYGHHYVNKSIINIIKIIYLVLGVYVLIFFRKLLNDKYRFSDVNAYIVVIIIFNVIISLIDILVASSYESIANFSIDRLQYMGPTIFVVIFSLLLFIAYGIIMIVFSVRLLHLRDNLSGLLKPFCYLTITTAICNITLLLITFGMIPAMASEVILGLIFLKSANKKTITVRIQKSNEIPIQKASNIPDQIEQLANLKEKGILTEVEFEEKKKDLLSKI